MQFSVSRPQAVKTGNCSAPVTRAAETIKPVTIITAYFSANFGQLLEPMVQGGG